MRTKLYRHKDTDNILTFAEVLDEYREKNNSDLPIPPDEAELIVIYQLAKNGGNYNLLDDNDKLLKWCNDYAELNEADRYFSKDERDDSVRHTYIIISSNSYPKAIERLQDNLIDNYCEEAEELLKQLNEFLIANSPKRLTKRTNEGLVGNNDFVSNYPLYNIYNDIEFLDGGLLKECFEKLSAYEDIGTVEEFKSLKGSCN